MSNAKVRVSAKVTATIPGAISSRQNGTLEVAADAAEVTLVIKGQGSLAQFTTSTSQLHAVLAAARALEVEQ